ncbi:MAG: hypothetical protein A3A98_01955 [Candidatus Staskawiczbacteria bacterium RIFCSPLOWO2_01_FULL_40_39]|uniref:Cell division protein FtsL n=1 Tax=Candidatus Staskawiczbacteria bacterium RIFCSPHIGHO2_01_FULL_39_25 TaxID=1802202 RepID=A0A1G2HQK8_9BACT|nr:MAG: hypothetical protein A2730_02110 [Candidatus Staskawiczbacteria bacterium RIFCSPHIGHO2_01_FULL_39_25]OGZ72731.1 MAG: hypothetical protein A3A98_01955 [Candidatus Staskawiczbacteria bacterium RIFCSPLOWO2_01_FULL_40_39]
MTTATLAYRAIGSKLAWTQPLRVNWKAMYILGIIFALLFCVTYIFGINQLTRGAYLIKNYNKEISSLLEENRKLEIDFAESGFLGGVQEKVKQLSFEKTKGVKYVQILDNSLVLSK